MINTSTNIPTNTSTNTSTYTPIFTNTYTNIFTNTNTQTLIDTKLATFTKTPTRTFTPTIIKEIEVITPETELPPPSVVNDSTKKTLKISLPKINHGSLNENKNTYEAKVKYIIHVRKLKRLGTKDTFYKLGKKILSYQSKNLYNFKNMDKGIYSIRYQVVITKGSKTKTTKWSKRTLVKI